MESRREHVGKHAGVDGVDALGDQGQIAVGVVDVEVLGKNAVFEVGEFPAGEHAAGMHGIAALGLKGVPVGRDRGHEHAVTGLEILDQRADFHDLGAAFVAENHVVPFADGPFPNRMDVRSADRQRKRFADRVHRTANRTVLLDPADFADFEHRVAFHNNTPLFSLE